MTTHSYEFLNPDNIAQYISSRPEISGLIDAENISLCNEIGDGNLNLVFIVSDTSGRSVVLKQALPYVRMVGEGWPMTPERANHEANALSRQYEADPEHTVSLFLHDPDRYIIAMEDLSAYSVWRSALNRGETHEGAAGQVGDFIARNTFASSVYGLDRFDYSARLAETQNPDLCTITEDLVFTEPAFDVGRNEVLPENESDVLALASDSLYIAAMGQAKIMFMTHAEALIHGDLHTGSVMVRTREAGGCDVRVFDPEFAFYGPVAFDLGAVIANFGFAAARATALDEHDRASWCVAQVSELLNGFENTFAGLWATRTEPTVWDDAHLTWQLGVWRQQAMLFAAAKLARRIVGAAKVTDIQLLEPELRAPAARAVLLAARDFAANWRNVDSAALFEKIFMERLLKV